MFRKMTVLSLVALFFLSGCQMSNLFADSQSQVKVTLNEVSDADLKSTAEGLAAVYQNKPKNQAGNVAQKLALPELQNTLGAETDLSGLQADSVRKTEKDVFYILKTQAEQGQDQFTVYKNKEPIFKFQSEQLNNYSSLVNARMIENKYTVEYLEKKYDKTSNLLIEDQKIWQEGSGEINTKYGLSNAIAPFEANGKMLFLGKKDAVWQIYYDGKALPEQFSSINFGYANEPALYLPKAFNYRYLVFFATQDEKSKIVEADFGGNEL